MEAISAGSRTPGQYVYDRALDWSPDGRHVLFVRCEAQIHTCDGSNWVMRPDGSHKHPIDASEREVYSPSGHWFAGTTSKPGVYENGSTQSAYESGSHQTVCVTDPLA